MRNVINHYTIHVNSKESKQRCYTIIIANIHKKWHNDIKYIINQTLSTNKIQILLFKIIFRGTKFVITKILYPKLGMTNNTIHYIQNISLAISNRFKMMFWCIHLLIMFYFDEIIQKHITFTRQSKTHQCMLNTFNKIFNTKVLCPSSLRTTPLWCNWMLFLDLAMAW